MQAIPIDSSALEAVAYDAATQRLEIEFRDGRTYEYRNIPAEVHRDLMRAPSKGQYFNAAIRARFPYRCCGARVPAGPA
jgi:hypothetical protein